MNNKLKTIIKRAPFTVAAAGAWTASMGFNAITGASMGGDDPINTAIWITAAVSLDMLKAGGAIRLTTAMNERRFGMASVAAGLMIIGTSVSLLSALTMRANSAAGDNAERQKVIESREASKGDIASAKAGLKNVRYARLIGAIEADIQKAQRHKRWRLSEQCSNATVQASISFCNRYNALSAEKAASATRINLQMAIIAGNKRLAAMPMPPATVSPVADTVGTILTSAGIKADPANVADWIMIFMTIAIEFGAVAGPAMAFDGPAKPKRKKKSKLDISKLTKQQQVIHYDIEMTRLDGRAPSNKELAQAVGCNAATVTRAKQARTELLAEMAAI